MTRRAKELHEKHYGKKSKPNDEVDTTANLHTKADQLTRQDLKPLEDGFKAGAVDMTSVGGNSHIRRSECWRRTLSA